MKAERTARIRKLLLTCLPILLLAAPANSSEPDDDSFVFRWRADENRAVIEYSSHVNKPLVVEFLDEEVKLPDASAAQTLLREHGILLSDEEQSWNANQAHLLLAALRDLQPPTGDNQDDRRSKWILTSDHVDRDITSSRTGESMVVRISAETFSYASPRSAEIDGRRGTLLSRRLHHAVTRFVTDEGRDRDVVDQLLKRRHGASISVPDYVEMTVGVTNETAEAFQEFHPDELLAILQQFEELPPALRRMHPGIYLVRRLDGTRHPLHPQSPAVSWPTVEPGYIEFMERAFTNVFPEHSQKLILHEKAHFLWTRVLSEEFRANWTEAGGWKQDQNVLTAWTSDSTSQFVSEFAHATNPVEDLAESFAYFVVNPDKLRSRAPVKFDLVRDAIAEGGVYLSRIREDLTFQVENLAPDYVYPSRIRGVTVTVDGAPREDKVVTIDLELDSQDPRDTASRGLMRIFSANRSYLDVHLHPIDPAGRPVKSGSLLRGRFDLSKYSESGYWWPRQIVLHDAGGNQRFQGPGDYGWKMYVDNPLADPVGPRYVRGSLRMRVDREPHRFDHPVQTILATWAVDEDVAMPRDRRACSATLVNRESGAYSFTQYGLFDPSTGLCSVEFVLTEFAASGTYTLSTLRMGDAAGNGSSVTFTDAHGEAPLNVEIATSTPDSLAPEVDLNEILVRAEPTRPESPNGETRVTVVYHARDDLSGLGRVSLSFRDPQGIDHLYYDYHENFRTVHFQGDATRWIRYEKSILLPEGSVPGTWGLSTMQVRDKANNVRNHDFSETLRFEVSW